MRFVSQAIGAGIVVLVMAVTAMAATIEYHIGTAQTGGASITVPFTCDTNGDSIASVLWTVDYDSTEVAFDAVVVDPSIDTKFSIVRVNEALPTSGTHKRVLIWVETDSGWEFFVGVQPVAQMTFTKVSCGAATLALPDVCAWQNASTVTLEPHCSAAPYNNVDLYAGYITFQCGGGGGELDKPSDAWTKVKELYR